MVIELRGVDFINKGGELMLYAIISKVRMEIPGALFVMESSLQAPRIKHLKYGIYTKSNFKKYNIPVKYFFKLVPLFLRRRWGYINEDEITVVLDSSGFAFGEVWGVRKAGKRLGDHIVKWKQRAKKVILLPQAFGPFSSPALVTVMKRVIAHSDLIFARDQLSLSYLEQLEAHSKKFFLAPDFTNLVKGITPAYFNSSECEVAIIVNSKMIKVTSEKEGNAYFDLLYRMIGMIKTLGYKPYFLMHEGLEDRNSIDIINTNLPVKLPVVEEDNPVYVKGMIAKSKAVFTSRFHGLVSSLSQAVPCLATGWSHKYEMLLNDYDYPEGLLNVYSDDETLLAKLKQVLTAPSQNKIVDKLKSAASKQQHRSEEMWKKVFAETGRGKPENIYSLNPGPAISSGLL